LVGDFPKGEEESSASGLGSGADGRPEGLDWMA